MARSPVWLSPAEAAEMLGVSVRTLHRWEAQGRITSVRTVGNHRRFKLADVERLFLASQPKASA